MGIARQPHKAPLILLLGMGADERLFRYQKAAFPNLIVPSWIEPDPKERLSDYAERLARSVDPGVPCFVGGASFGGIVALGMVPHLQARACFLIGSIRSPDQLPWQMRMFRPLSRITPDQFAQFTALCLRLSKPSLPGRAYRQLGRYAEPNANFLRWATLAVLEWKPQRSGTTPVYYIHGELARPKRRYTMRTFSLLTLLAACLLPVAHAAEHAAETTAGWVKHPMNPVLGGKLGTCFDISVLKEGDTYRMWFSWRPKKSIALVESKDGVQWSKPIIVLGPNEKTDWENDLNRPVVIKHGDHYQMWYTG